MCPEFCVCAALSPVLWTAYFNLLESLFISAYIFPPSAMAWKVSQVIKLGQSYVSLYLFCIILHLSSLLSEVECIANHRFIYVFVLVVWGGKVALLLHLGQKQKSYSSCSFFSSHAFSVTFEMIVFVHPLLCVFIFCFFFGSGSSLLFPSVDSGFNLLFFFLT